MRVDADGTDIALQGIDDSADVEIGSVSKALTGMLYTDAVSRGQVNPEMTLGELLPLADCPAGRVTLARLATHSSGLPRLASDSDILMATWRMWRYGTNPYGASLETLFERTRKTPVGRPRPSYSNLGFMLLGHAVAAAAGTTYAVLFADKLAAPLGLRDANVPSGDDELGPMAVMGTNRRGRVVEAWTGADLGPAGGVRLSARDLAGLLAALLDGTAPGMAALDPVRRFGWGNRIGAGWMTTATAAGDVSWHNGGTGGFRSFVALNRERRLAVAIVTATSRSVDSAGFTLVKPSRSQ